jgi:hypothetical protein
VFLLVHWVNEPSPFSGLPPGVDSLRLLLIPSKSFVPDVIFTMKEAMQLCSYFTSDMVSIVVSGGWLADSVVTAIRSNGFRISG